MSNSPWKNCDSPTVKQRDASQMCGKITINEVKLAVEELSRSKTPGTDGLPVEFYIKFWNEIGELLTAAYQQVFEDEKTFRVC